MEIFDLGRFFSHTSTEAIHRFDAKLDQLAETGHYHEAVNHFLATVPVFAPALYSEDYFRGQLSYLRALLSAALGDMETAVARMEAAQVDLAGDSGDLLFSDHLARAVQLHERQQRAIAAGKPAILVTALPKSGSAFLSNSLAKALDIPLVHASLGAFPNMTVVPRWMRQLAQGGCVTHDHFDGRASNLAPILENGISHVFVQLRDPRAALWSYFHFQPKMLSDPTVAHDLSILIESFYAPAIAWIESWFIAAALLAGRASVHFLDYETITTHPAALCGAILKASGAERFIPEVATFFADGMGTAEAAANFRTGKLAEWREQMPEIVRERLWELTSPLVRERMALEP